MMMGRETVLNCTHVLGPNINVCLRHKKSLLQGESNSPNFTFSVYGSPCKYLGFCLILVDFLSLFIHTTSPRLDGLPRNIPIQEKKRIENAGTEIVKWTIRLASGMQINYILLYIYSRLRIFSVRETVREIERGKSDLKECMREC